MFPVPTSPFVFPSLAVCFHCGFTEFTIPKRELQVLERGSPVDGAAVLPQRVSQPSETKKTITFTGSKRLTLHRLVGRSGSQCCVKAAEWIPAKKYLCRASWRSHSKVVRGESPPASDLAPLTVSWMVCSRRATPHSGQRLEDVWCPRYLTE
jgi:hypothetical protein